MSTSQDGYQHPRASFVNGESNYSQTSSPTNSTAILPKAEHDGQHATRSAPKKRGLAFWLACLAALVVIILAIILPIYFTVIKKKDNNSNSPASTGNGTDSGGHTGNGTTPSATGAITGRDGSQVTLEDGSTFTYSNQFGGFWVSDPSDPFASGAKPNSWTPALNETWTYGKDHIFGYIFFRIPSMSGAESCLSVNLGGWLVLEPFISPALFQKYPGTVDEWTLSEAMAADPDGGGLDQLEEHYKTFIVCLSF